MPVRALLGSEQNGGMIVAPSIGLVTLRGSLGVTPPLIDYDIR